MRAFILRPAAIPFGAAALNTRQYLSAVLEDVPISEHVWLKAAAASPPSAQALGFRTALRAALAGMRRDLSVLFDNAPTPEHAWLRTADSPVRKMPSPMGALNGRTLLKPRGMHFALSISLLFLL
ncbi:hypothetical protein [Microvirga makkahensis]|uniref:Uncharacterized protein n=1 Tax=Microvirga makkahensis TaxID=1128670 RepID=A0A7X3MUF8_9HYPH|nr:hypothetical protein [Microvirga makkahensis]MXQ13452.1 hypothetical protein [Microvirga makkahensis]